MPRRPLANVWAAGCPKCHVGVNEYCRDLRGNNRVLFGRRTHKERARVVKAMASKSTVQITLSANTTSTFVYNPEVWQRWTGSMNAVGTAISNTTISINRINEIVWDGWVNTGTTTYTGDQVWNNWNAQFRVPEVAYRQVVQTQADLEQARRERASRAALRTAQDAQIVERRVMAASRALELLDMILTPDQREERHRDQQVTVQAPSGRRYIVEMHRQTVHGNIVEIDAHGCRLGRGCVAPGMYDEGGALPTADGWVGQVLALQYNEEELRRKTNWSNLQRCRQPNVPILERAA